MFIVYAKHYLNKEGVKYFTAEWFPRVKSRMEKQVGIVSLKHDVERDQNDCVNLTIKFEDEAVFTTWRQHAQHAAFVDELDPYRSRPYREYAIAYGEMTDPAMLKWMEIKINLSTK